MRASQCKPCRSIIFTVVVTVLVHAYTKTKKCNGCLSFCCLSVEEELAHPESWKIASSFISKALDDASKTTPARRVRQSLTAAAKQFKFMSLAMDKRVEKIRQLDQEILDSGGEMTKLKKNNEILRDTKKKLQVKYEKMEYKNNDLLQKLVRINGF